LHLQDEVMSTPSRYETLDREAILAGLVEILKDMTSDWDLDFAQPLGPSTKLIDDLGFESIDVVQFVVAIEEHFQRRGLPFEEFLMVDGRYVDELEVGEVADFLHRHLNGEAR
jgi:acyl carrier protein